MSKETSVSYNSLSILLSSDGMRLYMSYEPKDGEDRPELENVLTLTRKLKVKEEFLNENLDSFFIDNEAFSHILIAEGILPKNGFDAKILYELDVTSTEHSHSANDKPVIPLNLKDVIQVRKGDLIAQKLPAAKGLPGTTLRGETIEFHPTDFDLPAGKNTKISVDGLSLISTASGMLVYRDELVSIEETFEINSDVGYNTGNIEFLGNLKINGDVKPGFKLEADGNIEITGCSEGANLTSRKGSIKVLLGIIGKNISHIIAAKNLEAGFIQDAKITVGKDVIAGRYILNSDLNAEGCIKVLDSEGTIRGGKISSKDSIQAKVAGSTNMIPTRLKVGRNLDGETLKRVLEIDRHVGELSSKESMNIKQVQFIDLLNERVDELPENKKAEKELLLHANKEINQELRKLNEEKTALLSDSMTKEMEKRIKISSKVFPGVIINIDTEELLVQQELLGSIFKLEEGTIKVEHTNSN